MAKCTRHEDAKKLTFELTSDEFASLLEVSMYYNTNLIAIAETVFSTGLSSFEILLRMKRDGKIHSST